MRLASWSDPARIAELIAIVRPAALQIHSEVLPAACAALRSRFDPVRIIKSYHVTGRASLEYGEAYADLVDGFLLDTWNPDTGQVGGTGLTHDWDRSVEIVARYEVPVMLAGGLTPENVAAAIARVRPYGVDVNSGVKALGARQKDAEKVREFVRRAKSV